MTFEKSNQKKYSNLLISFNNTCYLDHLLEAYLGRFEKKRYIISLKRSVDNEHIEYTDLIKSNINLCYKSITYELVVLDNRKKELLSYIDDMIFKINNTRDHDMQNFLSSYENLILYIEKNKITKNSYLNKIIMDLKNNYKINLNFDSDKLDYKKNEYLGFLNEIYYKKHEKTFDRIVYSKKVKAYNQTELFRINKFILFFIFYILISILFFCGFKFFEQKR